MNVDMKVLEALTQERKLPLAPLVIAIENAVIAAYREVEGNRPFSRASLDRETGEMQILSPVHDEAGEKIGEEVHVLEGFERIATSTIRSTIKMKMREANDAEIVGEFTAAVGDIVTGIIQQGRDPKIVHVNLGRIEGKIPPQEQVPGEVYNHGDRIKSFVVEVKQGTRGPEIMLSRSHPAFVKQLFALEVPE
ncbi:MAG: transcription termination/antitermination protein NusA, partial [Actinobacteria bacterium]|nr:transcription termination/antitermination protein NusA [Actinomycetota bacterium]